MRRVHVSVVLGVVALLITVPVSAMTVEEVIAKHVEARGGAERWAQIDSMKISGNFLSFSKVSPFTLIKKRENLYHMDSTQNERIVVVGNDGVMPWWDNRWFGEGAQPIGGPDLEAQTRNFDFVNPLFDYAARGYEVSLIAETEIEGIPAIGIELTRGPESKETWYLDPETYLELARVSPGSDFGRPMEQTTFFDDFRSVDGVMVPYLVETQWYTRDRVMNVENVEFNVSVDEALFVMPAPPGMGPIRPMVGSFSVSRAARPQPGADWTESEREAQIDSLMNGALLQEQYTSDDGTNVLWSLSYDQFSESYRMTRFQSDTRQMSIQVGTFDEDGRLSLSNLETGTSSEAFGMTFFLRMSIFGVEQDSFKVEMEVSIDGGESWFVAAKEDYTRKE